MNNKYKILIFIDWFLPGFRAGGPIRSIANLIEHLSEFFDFFIVTSDTDYLQNKPYDNIEPDKWLNFNFWVKIIYLSKQNLKFNTIKNLIEQQNYDLILINGIFSVYFSIVPLYFAKRMKKKIIVSPRGMLSQQAFSRKAFVKKLFIKVNQILGFYKNVIFHTTSVQENNDVLALLSRNKIYFIPNLPRKILLKNNNNCLQKQKGKLKLVSIARISQEKNTKFALEILSNIVEGKVEFDIYGGIYDKDYWQQCSQIIEKIENVKVKYCGTIDTQKVQQTFANYHFAFMPSKAENFGHSILECLSAGTPVIISNTTPWQNLQYLGIGWDLELEDKNKFVDVIKQSINMENEQYQQMRNNASEFAKNYFKNNSDAEKYIKMFTDVAQQTI